MHCHAWKSLDIVLFHALPRLKSHEEHKHAMQIIGLRLMCKYSMKNTDTAIKKEPKKNRELYCFQTQENKLLYLKTNKEKGKKLIKKKEKKLLTTTTTTIIATITTASASSIITTTTNT